MQKQQGFRRERGFGQMVGYEKKKLRRLTEKVRLLKFENGVGEADVRFIGGVVGSAIHWIPSIMETGKYERNFPKACLAYDDETESIDSTKVCPYCELSRRIPEYFGSSKAQIRYYANIIDRDAQASEPRNATPPTEEEARTGYFSGVDSRTWSPVKVVQMPPGVVTTLRVITQQNKVAGESTFRELNDPDYGRDVKINYDKKRPATNVWVLSAADRTPLDDHEKAYLRWNLYDGDDVEDLDTAKREAASIENRYRRYVLNDDSVDEMRSESVRTVDEMPRSEYVSEAPRTQRQSALTSPPVRQQKPQEFEEPDLDDGEDEDFVVKPTPRARPKPDFDDEEPPRPVRKASPRDFDDDDEDDDIWRKQSKPTSEEEDDGWSSRKPVRRSSQSSMEESDVPF